LQHGHLPRREGRQNGFKLSLRGYDPDLRRAGLVDDQAGRRANRAVAGQQPDAAEGERRRAARGRRAHRAGRGYYEILRAWIADGGLLTSTPRVTGIEVQPAKPGGAADRRRQQLRVVPPTPTAPAAT
jgi:hypothetical protein